MSNMIDTLYAIQQDQKGTNKLTNFSEIIEDSDLSAPQEELSPQAVMPYAIKYYDIDLETRTIDAPEYLSVAKDHYAENIYFRVNRFFDYMDLATTTCVIQYKNAAGQTGVYAVPYFDIESGKGNSDSGCPDKLIIPWCIAGKASAVDGNITYALRFYRIDINGDRMIYNLNTRPATSKILYGMNVSSPDVDGDYDIPPTVFDQLVQMIDEVRAQDVYWLEYK